MRTVLNSNSIQKLHESEILIIRKSSELTYYNSSLNTNNDNDSDDINNLKILNVNNLLYNNLNANMIIFDIFSCISSFFADLMQIQAQM